MQKIFETFGIKARTRNAEVTALLRQLYHLQDAEAPVVKLAATEGKDDGAPKSTVKSRQPKARRRPSRKAEVQKAK